MARQATAWKHTTKSQNGGKSKTREKDYRFATQDQMGKGNYGTYNTVKDAIVQEVQEKYKYGSDIAKSIRQGKLFDIDSVMPIRKVSKVSDAEAKKDEQDGFNIRFQEELRVWMDRKFELEMNQSKAFSLIFSTYCTKQMQQRIEEHPDYEKSIVDDPVKLVIEIKTLTHDSVRAEYPIASIVDHFNRWLNMKQWDEENLTDYVKRSKYNRDIVKSLIGNEILHKHIKSTDAYANANTTEQKDMLDGSFEQLSTYVMMRGADGAKYGDVMKGFVRQYTLNNDQYPKRMTDAVDVLAKHPFDDRHYEKLKRQREKNRERKKEKENDEQQFVQHKTKGKPICY